jgi:hypothetical protein
VYFGQFVKMTDEAQNVWTMYTFPERIDFDKKWIALHIGRFFQKLIWDRCYDFSIFSPKISAKNRRF